MLVLKDKCSARAIQGQDDDSGYAVGLKHLCMGCICNRVKDSRS